MASRLLKPGTTYLPYGFSQSALTAFGAGDLGPLLSELPETSTYERVGIDRALAIAVDLALRGQPPGSTILDVGCSVGTIGRLLAEIGYRVTGIDSDVVAKAQEWQDEEFIAQARGTQTVSRFRFIESDLRDFLNSNTDRFDVALLLSILHHWLAGYGYTGIAQFDRAEVRHTLLDLCSRVRDSVFLECPIEDEYIEMPPDPEGEFVFPRWFLDMGLAKDVTLIASTIATNGKPRRLYRVWMA